jgi:hypothetical protein
MVQNKKIDKGIWTQDVDRADSWKEFNAFVCDVMLECDKRGESVCWRGQPKDEELLSLFDRIIKGKISNAGARQKVLAEHRRFCAYAFRGILQNPSVRELKQAIREKHLNPNHFWAIGRHYDLATPLLDWTLSPFVAAFFAFEEERKAYETRFEQWFDNRFEVELKKWCEEKSKKTASDQIDTAPLWSGLKRELFPDHRVVCALKYKRLQEGSMKEAERIHERRDDDEGRPHMREDDTSHAHRRDTDAPWSFRTHRREDDLAQTPQFQWFDPLSCEHLRLLNQRGIFTITPNGESVEELVNRLFPGEHKEWVLLKIKIPSTKDVREESLKRLNWVTINHLSLFPDLLGASKFCNRELERVLSNRQS